MPIPLQKTRDCCKLFNSLKQYCLLQASTTENVAIYVWDQLQRIMEKPQLLHEVKILETEKNHVVYRGGNTYSRKKPDSSCHRSHVSHEVSSDSD